MQSTIPVSIQHDLKHSAFSVAMAKLLHFNFDQGWERMHETCSGWSYYFPGLPVDSRLTSAAPVVASMPTSRARRGRVFSQAEHVERPIISHITSSRMVKRHFTQVKPPLYGRMYRMKSVSFLVLSKVSLCSHNSCYHATHFSPRTIPSKRFLNHLMVSAWLMRCDAPILALHRLRFATRCPGRVLSKQSVRLLIQCGTKHRLYTRHTCNSKSPSRRYQWLGRI